MATSTQQKQELFKAIWATAEDLRNSVDAIFKELESDSSDRSDLSDYLEKGGEA